MNDEIRKPTQRKTTKTPPKKGKAGLIVILVLVLLIGGLILIIGLNLFNFREGVVMSYLRNAPLIGNLLPAAEQENYDEIPLELWPPGQLAERIRELEREVDTLEAQLHEMVERSRADALRIARLYPFYENWSEYQRVVAEFNAMVARGDPERYLAFFAYILPEFHEQLARDSMLLYRYQESVMSIVRSLLAMQERNAAEILEDLRTTDLMLLTNVLNAMGDTRRGEILEQMDADVAASMLRLISVTEPILSPLGPALFTPPLPLTYEEIHAVDDYEEYDADDEDDE